MNLIVYAFDSFLCVELLSATQCYTFFSRTHKSFKVIRWRWKWKEEKKERKEAQKECFFVLYAWGNLKSARIISQDIIRCFINETKMMNIKETSMLKIFHKLYHRLVSSIIYYKSEWRKKKTLKPETLRHEIWSYMFGNFRSFFLLLTYSIFFRIACSYFYLLFFFVTWFWLIFYMRLYAWVPVP